MRTSTETIVTDDDLKNAFGNADFGANITPRDLIKYTVLKYASGYESGHTAKCICSELGLITKNNQLTQKGKNYLWYAFNNGNSF